MKRAFVIAVLTAALVAGASVAEAAISKGTFKGKTSARDPVGFKVTKSGKVKSFYYEGVRLSCTDGDEFDSPTGSERIQTPSKVVFPVSSKRKFHIRARNNDTGFGWDAYGKFSKSGNKDTGTLKIFAQFNDQNQQDPEGSIHCESEKLPYTAKRG